MGVFPNFNKTLSFVEKSIDAGFSTVGRAADHVVDCTDRAIASAEKELGMPLLPEMEISYVRYPVGGYYQRHVDDVADADTLPELRASSLSSGACASETSRRAVSFVCSLVEGDWDADRDGGALRTFPAGRETEDLPMVSGDLILFDSCLLDHEVRSTRRERLVLVGWWHTPRQVENP